jgi:hypothetical protein
MKKVNIILSLIIVALFNGCYLLSPPDVLLHKDFDGNGIAVLNFSKYGPYLPPEITSITADKLTDALYLVGKFNVIDRAKVNDAQSSLELTSFEELSADKIQKLGLKLKANYLILGQIQNIANTDAFDTDSPKQLYISFRIISVVNSELVGMANYKITYKDNLIEEIKNSMELIVKKMASAK